MYRSLTFTDHFANLDSIPHSLLIFLQIDNTFGIHYSFKLSHAYSNANAHAVSILWSVSIADHWPEEQEDQRLVCKLETSTMTGVWIS